MKTIGVKFFVGFLACVSVVCFVNFVFADPGNVSVRINDESLTPEKIEIPAGTTIVWVNSADSGARVRFLSNAISTTCKAPRGFIVGSKGIFESEEIPGGDVASLCFLELETYDYKVELFNDGAEGKELAQTFHGRVVVTR